LKGMIEEKLPVEAHLLLGREKIPINVHYLSKYSIGIKFDNGNKYRSGHEFSKIMLRFNGEDIILGPCKLIQDSGNNGISGRLIFIRDIYDFRSLFFEHKIVKLQSAFFNLPLVLAHKDSIRSSFKEYTASLTYDLNVYKHVFDQLDQEYADEKEDVKQIIQKAILATEGRKLMNFLDEKIEELQILVSDFSADEHERHGYYFRRQLWNIISCSPIMLRTNMKPRGYAGDSEMMRMIYTNAYEGNTTFAKILHKHPMEHPAAQAVRTRRKLIASMLRRVYTGLMKEFSRTINVLSVACGPALELINILISPEDCEKYNFSLLDQDQAALSEAAQLIKQIEIDLQAKIDVDYLNESVRTMLTTERITSKWGQYHFIYSMGLFDYLTPPAARAVLAKLCQLLKPGGEMVIGNFHTSNASRVYMEYWLDWVLYYRNEEEFLDLLQGVDDAEATVLFENTGSQMFLHVKKRACSN